MRLFETEPHINSVVCWPQEKHWSLPVCTLWFLAAAFTAAWCWGFWWLSLLGKRGLMKLCTFSTVPEACNWGKCLRLQFPDLSRGESWDSVFWITQLCRRKWSGYFPSVADSLSWTISASQVCRFLGFPELVLSLFAKYSSRKGNFASVNLAHLWLWDDIHLFFSLLWFYIPVLIP